jgi:hypothetical protein
MTVSILCTLHAIISLKLTDINQTIVVFLNEAHVQAKLLQC